MSRLITSIIFFFCGCFSLTIVLSLRDFVMIKSRVMRSRDDGHASSGTKMSEETSLMKLRDSSVQTNKDEDVKDIVQDC